MPTIDELSPAISVSDTDELMISQAGVARKATRAQILAGVQDQLVLSPGSLLGRVDTGIGGPEVISVGKNLILNGKTLSAVATPFFVNALPAGNVPGTGDLVSVSQGGTNVAVTYEQFIRGIPEVANVDLSQALVTPAGAGTSQTLANIAASMVSNSGGSLSGSLYLSADPSAPLQAATKAYVDNSAAKGIALTGASLSGPLFLSGPPVQPLQSATKSYVDSVGASVLSISGGSLTGSLLLAGDPVIPLQSVTKRYADLKVSKSGDTMAGLLSLASDPTAPLQAATKNYVDATALSYLPKAGGTLTGPLALAADPTLNAQAATKQYVDARLYRRGDTLSGPLVLAADPSTPQQAATKNYVDRQVSQSVLQTGSSLTGALLLASDPAVPLQAATKQYVDLRVVRAGDSFTGALYLASDPVQPLQASTKQYVDTRLAATISPTGATFVGPVTLAADPTAALQAATKQYTDTRILRAGDTLSGTLVLAADPTQPSQAATKNYVDNKLATTLVTSGGTVVGNVILAADPVVANQAATKHYVDTQVATSLPIGGGTVTGSLSLLSVPSTPLQAATKQYVDNSLGLMLPLQGGSLSGMLTLSKSPTLPLHAATKQYVDANPATTGVINVAMAPYGAALNGVTDDTAAFKSAYAAAPAGSAIYVPYGKTVLQQPGSWGIALTKKVKWIIDGTTLADGTPLASAVPTGGGPSGFSLPGFCVGNSPGGFSVSQNGSASTDLAVQQSSYIVGHNGGSSGVITNSRCDTIIYNSPANFVWGGLDRLLWSGVQTPAGYPVAQHVGRYVQTLREGVSLGSNGLPLPQPQLWAACLEYRDFSGLPSSSSAASLTCEMDWFGNGLDDANNRCIQSLVIGQAKTSGTPVELATIIGVWLAGGSSGSAKTVFEVTIPFSNAVLDTTTATQINSAPAIRMAAGQAIAFEATNTCRLYYDGSTGTLRWANGSTSAILGKGITVGWQNVYSSSSVIPNYFAGNILFLTGNSPYTMTLPPAAAVAAGTGFTFSVTGSGPVTISPYGQDSIDCGPIVLRQNDRYHIASDGNGNWCEIFRSNAVAPKWTAPPILPNYTVAALPANLSAGSIAFATNGRKPGEAAGAGSGVQVFFDGQHWISSSSGSAVSA